MLRYFHFKTDRSASFIYGSRSFVRSITEEEEDIKCINSQQTVEKIRDKNQVGNQMREQRHRDKRFRKTEREREREGAREG